MRKDDDVAWIHTQGYRSALVISVWWSVNNTLSDNINIADAAFVAVNDVYFPTTPKNA